MTADVTDEASIAQLYRAGAKRRAAHSTSSSPMPAWPRARRPHKTSLAELWQQTLDVNLTGAFLTVQPALAGMRERKMGPHRLHRLDRRPEGLSLCRALCGGQAWRGRADARAWRWRPPRTGVTVNAVCPGFTETADAGASPSSASPTRPGRSEAEARAQPGGAQPAGPLHPAGGSRRRGAVALRRRQRAAITGQAISVSGGETW